MAMSLPSVAITGIGVVSPFGVGRERFWQHVRNGCSATRTVTEFDATPYGSTVAAPVPRVSMDDAVALAPARRASRGRNGRPDPRRYSRASLIGVIAATEAWADAGLSGGEPHAGVLVGSGAGGIDVAERQYFEFFTDGWKRVTKSVVNKSGLKVYLIQNIDRKIALNDMARSKGMPLSALLTEIETIVASGTRIDINYYINEVIDEDRQKEVFNYFKTAETDSAEEALGELGENEYSLDDIRLMRIKFMSELGN
jgi:hypothetical protein